MASGIVHCGCGWRGVPTFVDGEQQPQCPACKREELLPLGTPRIVGRPFLTGDALRAAMRGG